MFVVFVVHPGLDFHSLFIWQRSLHLSLLVNDKTIDSNTGTLQFTSCYIPGIENLGTNILYSSCRQLMLPSSKLHTVEGAEESFNSKNRAFSQYQCRCWAGILAISWFQCRSIVLQKESELENLMYCKCFLWLCRDEHVSSWTVKIKQICLCKSKKSFNNYTVYVIVFGTVSDFISEFRKRLLLQTWRCSLTIGVKQQILTSEQKIPRKLNCNSYSTVCFFVISLANGIY